MKSNFFWCVGFGTDKSQVDQEQNRRPGDGADAHRLPDRRRQGDHHGAEQRGSARPRPLEVLPETVARGRQSHDRQGGHTRGGRLLLHRGRDERERRLLLGHPICHPVFEAEHQGSVQQELRLQDGHPGRQAPIGVRHLLHDAVGAREVRKSS